MSTCAEKCCNASCCGNPCTCGTNCKCNSKASAQEVVSGVKPLEPGDVKPSLQVHSANCKCGENCTCNPCNCTEVDNKNVG